MQKKLREIYQPSDIVKNQSLTAKRLDNMGLGGNMSRPTQEAYAKSANQAKKDLDSFIGDQAKGQEKLGKMIAVRVDKLGDLKKQQEAMVRGSKEELDIRQKISRVEENNYRLREGYKQRDATLNQLLDARKKVAPNDIPSLINSFQNGGFRYGMSQVPGAFQQNPAGMLGSVASGIGSAMSIGADVYRDYKNTPLKTENSRGNAVSGIEGRDVGNTFARRTVFEQNFQAERQRAAAMSIEKMNANKAADKVGLAGDLLKIGGGAAMAFTGARKGSMIGGAMGAVGGSIVPGLGNAVGGASLGTMGGIAGAIPGAMMAGKGLYNLATDERKRALMLSPFSKTYSDRLESMYSEQLSGDYNSAYDAQKKQNPYKTAAVGDYEQNYMRDLKFQRMTGQSNNEFRGQQTKAAFTPEMQKAKSDEIGQKLAGSLGDSERASLTKQLADLKSGKVPQEYQRASGDTDKDYFEGPTGKTVGKSRGFQQRATDEGFTPEMAMEMAQSIIGSGGSTRMARESNFGNKMERNMDMTNAGQVLGTISGGVGDADLTQMAAIKVIEAGTRQGLDASKFAEENRRFTQTAAELIARSGSNSEGDFGRIAQNFQGYIADNTNKGMEAAKGAYQQYQDISSTTTGPRGVMRAAGFMKDDKLSQLSTVQKQALMQVPDEELNSNNMLVQGAADKLGLSSDDLVKKIKGVNDGAVSRFAEADKLRDKIKGKGIDVSKADDPEYRKSLSKEDREDLFNLQSYQSTELGYKDQRQSKAFLQGTVGKPEEYGPAVSKEAVQFKLDKKADQTGRMEDNTVAAQAGDAATVLKNFNEMRGGMDDASKSAAKFTDSIRELNAELQRALETARSGGGSSGITDVLQKIMGTTGAPTTQQQGGKVSQ